MPTETDSQIIEQYRAKIAEFEKARREVERVRQDAINELLRQRREVTAQLRQLGYEGESAGDGQSVAVPAAPRLRKADTAERLCPVCKVQGHDMRAHRGQDVKRPFSESELRKRGLLATA